MPNRRLPLQRLLALAVFATVLACMDSAFAQSGSDVCLRSGMTVHAIRIEPNGARFKLYFDTASPPLEVGADEIKSIGERCAGAAASPAGAPVASPKPDAPAQSFAIQSFGIHGSNTIGEQLMPMLIDAYAAKRFGNKPSYRARAPEELDIEIGRRSTGGTHRPSGQRLRHRNQGPARQGRKHRHGVSPRAAAGG